MPKPTNNSTNTMNIRKIISRHVITVPPDTPLNEAVTIMAQSKISCLVVTEKQKPLGIFTERDLVKMAYSRMTGNSRQSIRPIRELMTSPVITIPGSMSVYEAYSLMLINKIRHHVVVDHTGKVLGLMTQSDLINHLGHEYFVEMRKVEQVMTANVRTIEHNALISEALVAMAESGISCVVVENDGRPHGIMTERDVVKLVADCIDPQSTPVSAIMSSPVLTVTLGMTIHNATVVMQRERIRRVVVVDDEGRTKGIITQSDIVKGLEGKYIDLLKEIIREKESVFQQTARELLDKTVYLDNILNSSISMGIIAMDSDFGIRYFNPMAKQIFNYGAPIAIGYCATELFALENIAPVSLPTARGIVRKKGKCTFPAEIVQEGGSLFYDGSLSGIMDKQERLVGFVLMLNDVTERKQHEDTIRHLAYHDALTGLPNRALLNDRLGQALAAAQRNRTRGALMMLDLDRFKDVNDTLGHSMGDLLLTEVSERLRSVLRKSDTVSRMGGDEFVLLLPVIGSPESADITAGKIIKAFNEPFDCNGQILNITASIGIADFPDDGEDSETLLKNADIALYRAKEQGRNNFQRYTASVNDNY